MPNPNQWGPRGGRAPGQPPVAYAQVSRLQPVPTSFTDPLFVVLPYDQAHAIRIDNWPVIHGATLPAAGADVTLVRDDQQNWRIVWWDGADSAGTVDATKINGVTVPLTGSAWIAPTLINSWVNFGGGFEVAGYLKDPLGFVHLKGRITGGSGVAFILPADYRPGAEIYQCAISGSGLVGYYTLTTAGAFTPAPASGQADVSLAGITFLAEN